MKNQKRTSRTSKSRPKKTSSRLSLLRRPIRFSNPQALIIVVGVILIGVLVVAFSSAAAATPEIQSSLGKCLDNYQNSTANGNKVDIYTCNGSGAQQWVANSNGTIKVDGKCLDDLGWGTANGTRVDLWTCNGGNNQAWRVTSSHQIVSVHANKCLDIPGFNNTNGAALDLWNCTGGTNQKWSEAKYTPPLPTATPKPPVTNPTATPAQPTASGAQYWALATAAAQGTFPRSDAYCAARVQVYPERIAANVTANHTVFPAGTNFHWGAWTTQTAEMKYNFSKVTGNFSGTTDEILEWAACKWGMEQNIAKAEAISESSWHQSTVGDSGESYGILQVRSSPTGPATKNDGWGGYPYTQESTALDADAQMAYLRTVYDGESYMGAGPKGDIWRAVSSWQSGSDTGDSTPYVLETKKYLANQTWLQMH
jgi:hypothetical protein